MCTGHRHLSRAPILLGLALSAPESWICADNGDDTERGKDRGENKVIHSPG
jgi:hypothetical protein